MPTLSKPKRVLLIAILLVAAGPTAYGLWTLWQDWRLQSSYSTEAEAGETLIEQGSFGEAVARLEDSLEAARKFEPGDPRLDEAMNRLAEVYSAQGLYVESQHMYFASLNERVTKYGSVHPETADALSNLGRVLELQEQYESAEGMYNQAADVWTKLEKADDPASTAVYLGLARVLAKRKSYEEALAEHRKALRIQESILKEDDPELAPLLYGLAALLQTAGHEAEAESVLARATRLAPRDADS
jgi:tetratricopeptide (TPR) repeat protein